MRPLLAALGLASAAQGLLLTLPGSVRLPGQAESVRFPWAADDGCDVRVSWPLRASWSRRKASVLRWRISQARCELDALTREAEALNRRLEGGRPLRSEEYAAETKRIVQLRSEAKVAEARIVACKRKLGAKGKTRGGWFGQAARASESFAYAISKSRDVLLQQLQSNPADSLTLLAEDAGSILRLGANWTIAAGYLPRADRLIAHAPAIYLRASILESMELLDEYLDLLEPHLDEILERFDEIEPHMPYILENVDALAPHCGELLAHLDTLLPYADDDEVLADLLEYLPFFAPRLDELAPHLPLLRQHLPLLMPALPSIYQYTDRFIPYTQVSANADLLIHYFGKLNPVGAIDVTPDAGGAAGAGAAARPLAKAGKLRLSGLRRRRYGPR